MIAMLTVYKNVAGHVFFRVSATAGRTSHYRIQAETKEQLELWLSENGFERLPDPSSGR